MKPKQHFFKAEFLQYPNSKQAKELVDQLKGFKLGETEDGRLIRCERLEGTKDWEFFDARTESKSPVNVTEKNSSISTPLHLPSDQFPSFNSIIAVNRQTGVIARETGYCKVLLSTLIRTIGVKSQMHIPEPEQLFNLEACEKLRATVIRVEAKADAESEDFGSSTAKIRNRINITMRPGKGKTFTVTDAVKDLLSHHSTFKSDYTSAKWRITTEEGQNLVIPGVIPENLVVTWQLETQSSNPTPKERLGLMRRCINSCTYI